jgi:branched-chain amino acid transport system permease protein
MQDSRAKLKTLLIVAAVFAAWLGVGLVVTNSYYRLVLTLVPIWAVLAISWNLLSGYSGLVSFGHAAFFGLGAFTLGLSMKFLDLTPWFGIPLATLVGAIAGAAIGYPSFRLRGTYFALSMLAYPLAFIAVFEWMGLQELAIPMKRDAPLWYAQFPDFRAYLVMALALLAVATVISLRVEGSRFGLSLLAIKQNELAAEAAGIDTFRWKMRAMVLSAALAATAGALYTMVVLVITPASVFGVVVSAQAMVLTLFGGAGTFWGPLIGSAILVPLSEFLNAELGHILPGIQGLVYGVAIIFVVLLAPEGIYWRLRDVLARRAGRRAAEAPVTAESAPALIADVPRPPIGEIILDVRGVSKTYGGLKAVQQVTFDVREGEIVGIIGPNGAGKTTLFNLLNGVVMPEEGTVTFADTAITGWKPSAICRAGIGRTFQIMRPFLRMFFCRVQHLANPVHHVPQNGKDNEVHHHRVGHVDAVHAPLDQQRGREHECRRQHHRPHHPTRSGIKRVAHNRQEVQHGEGTVRPARDPGEQRYLEQVEKEVQRGEEEAVPARVKHEVHKHVMPQCANGHEEQVGRIFRNATQGIGRQQHRIRGIANQQQKPLETHGKRLAHLRCAGHCAAPLRAPPRGAVAPHHALRHAHCARAGKGHLAPRAARAAGEGLGRKAAAGHLEKVH